jgi:hypothetical protein
MWRASRQNAESGVSSGGTSNVSSGRRLVCCAKRETCGASETRANCDMQPLLLDAYIASFVIR